MGISYTLRSIAENRIREKKTFKAKADLKCNFSYTRIPISKVVRKTLHGTKETKIVLMYPSSKINLQHIPVSEIKHLHYLI